MTKKSSVAAIGLRGVRQNNLKNFDLDIPLGQLTVITGLSGSGKSSLAFDTLFAEGQRRYIETFSPYARQFFDRMDKPQVDRIEGIPPAIAIEQRNTVRTTRSTVGTMTELCDYLKLLWPHLAQLHCQKCGKRVRREPPPVIWESVSADLRVAPTGPGQALICFVLPLSAKTSLSESLELIVKQGYQRLLLDDEVVRITEAPGHAALRQSPTSLTIVQDRLSLAASQRARFIEACEQAYHFGKGRLAIYPVVDAGGAAPVQVDSGGVRLFSQGYHCAGCDLDYREPTPALFSFNHPLGACPTCKGFGRMITIDYNLAIPDRSKTLAQGCVRPWQTGHGLDSQRDLLKFCKAMEIPVNVPFAQLPKKLQDWVVDGDEDYGSDEEHEWPRAWYGVKGYFRWLESKAYKMHVRVLLSRYRAYSTCPDCQGQRFKPESLLFRVPIPAWAPSPPPADGKRAETNQEAVSPGDGAESRLLSLAELYALPVDQALAVVERIAQSRADQRSDPIGLALGEVRTRLRYLAEVGLSYLTLDRPMRTLSGGETERVNLTTCLGTRLCNTLFVLDEPSVGLHPRDTARLVGILHKLRDTGNTVVVVEHEASVMRAADRIVDLGPGHGEQGGHVVFHGPVDELKRHPESLTGQYLSGRKQIAIPARRPVQVPRHEDTMGLWPEAGAIAAAASEWSDAGSSADLQALHDVPGGALGKGSPLLKVTHATRHNLRDLSFALPLGRLVCLTGVSGSGKTTLVRELLLPALTRHLQMGLSATDPGKASDRLDQTPSSDEEDLSPETGGSVAGCVIEGWEAVKQVVLVDQSPLGKTPRSNPVVYIGAFNDIRELFAQTDLAKQRGLNGSAFSFNSGVGQCERCRGAGFEKIEMQFLSDIFIRCPDCNGRRYRDHILEIKLRVGSSPAQDKNKDKVRGGSQGWSVADFLEATVDDALSFLAGLPPVPAARRASKQLALLQEVGLGYLRLGQPINTLSGGESQRLKLVSHLAKAVGRTKTRPRIKRPRHELLARLSVNWFNASPGSRKADVDPSLEATEDMATSEEEAGSPPTLFLFDEPTTGLHFEDVRVLLNAFQRLVDAGHSLVVIEHNLDVIKCADWVIDLGPEAGAGGGKIVAQGTPEEIAACPASHTGQFLRELLGEREASRAPGLPSSAALSRR
ncbi:MAG TPA: excinuclease ABC subunit UvrA [Verrucomicrobiae bacterium]|nr:excinuclease ABC subunit UvrA [Verrucomicrobiae bacterium]